MNKQWPLSRHSLIPPPRAWLWKDSSSRKCDQYRACISAEIAHSIVLRMRGGQVDEVRAEELERTFEAKLQGYELILSRQKYLAGNVGPKNQFEI